MVTLGKSWQQDGERRVNCRSKLRPPRLAVQCLEAHQVENWTFRREVFSSFQLPSMESVKSTKSGNYRRIGRIHEQTRSFYITLSLVGELLYVIQASAQQVG